MKNQTAEIYAFPELNPRFDAAGFDEAMERFLDALYKLSREGHRELRLVYEKYRTVVDDYNAAFDIEQAIIQGRANNFVARYGVQAAAFDREYARLEKAIEKMANAGAPKDEIDNFIDKKGSALFDKYEEMLNAKKKSEYEYESAVEEFYTLWRQNAKYAAFEKEAAAVEQKYKRRRDAMRKPCLYDFPINQ